MTMPNSITSLIQYDHVCLLTLIVKDSEKTNRHEKGAGLLELSEKIILKRLSDNIVQNIISLEEVDSQGNIYGSNYDPSI